MRTILGGMGIGVIPSEVALLVANAGGYPVVSGTGAWYELVRGLQLGDTDLKIRQALAHFPNVAIVKSVVDQYLGSKSACGNLSLTLGNGAQRMTDLMVLGSFVKVAQVALNPDGTRRDLPVGLNLLTKLGLTIPACLYGAMLAGASGIFMGAGLPTQVPRTLDQLAQGQTVQYQVEVEGGANHLVSFDPTRYLAGTVQRPQFYVIVSSAILAQRIQRWSGVDGLIIEHHSAGGHSAPPRNKKAYSDQDEVAADQLRALTLPFWMAGGYAYPGAIRWVQTEYGAKGTQCGTVYAMCNGSNIGPDLRKLVFQAWEAGTLEVQTNSRVSPSGYPFKSAAIPGTLGDSATFRSSPRGCTVGALATLYMGAKGRVDLRCPAEPPRSFLAKGGEADQIDGRGCLCRSLLSTIGLGDGVPPVLTLGTNLDFLKDLGPDYSAGDAIQYLLS